MYAIRNRKTGALIRSGMHIKRFSPFKLAEYEIISMKNMGVDVKNYYVLKLKGAKR